MWGLPLHVPAVVDLLVRALQVAKALHGVHGLPELEDLLPAAVAVAAGLGAARPGAAEADERGCDTAGTIGGVRGTTAQRLETRAKRQCSPSA